MVYSFKEDIYIGAYMHEVYKEYDKDWYISMNGESGRANPMSAEEFMAKMLNLGASAETIMYCLNRATQTEMPHLFR